MKFIAAGEDLFFLVFSEGVLNDRIVFVHTQNEAERRIISFRAALPIKIVDLKLKLA